MHLNQGINLHSIYMLDRSCLSRLAALVSVQLLQDKRSIVQVPASLQQRSLKVQRLLSRTNLTLQSLCISRVLSPILLVHQEVALGLDLLVSDGSV